MYVCVGHAWECQFAVSLRNVNLRSHSECQFALMSGQDIKHYTTTSGRCFLAMEEGRKIKKPKKSVHRRSQESDRRTRKSSKVESMYWRFFTSQVYRLTPHDTVVLYCSLINEERCEASFFFIFFFYNV